MAVRHGRRATRVATGGLVMLATALAGCAGSSSGSPSALGSTPGPVRTSAAARATTFEPAVLTVAADGTVYSSNCEAGYVYRVPASGAVTVYAGTGASQYQGSTVHEGGSRQDTELDCPTGLAVDAAGRLLVADHANNRIRAIGPDGAVTTVVGAGPSGTAIDDGALVGDGGPATAAQLQEPAEMTFDAAGDLYIADRDNHVIRRVGTDGVITTVAGNGNRGFLGDGGRATEATLDRPSAVAIGADGVMYVLDGGNARVRAVDTRGVITTLIVDTSRSTHLGDGGPVARAHLDGLMDLVADKRGNLYIAGSGAVRVVDSHGVIRTVAGTGHDGCSGIGGPATKARITAEGLALDAQGRLYLAGGACGVLRLEPDGTITHVSRIA